MPVTPRRGVARLYQSDLRPPAARTASFFLRQNLPRLSKAVCWRWRIHRGVFLAGRYPHPALGKRLAGTPSWRRHGLRTFGGIDGPCRSPRKIAWCVDVGPRLTAGRVARSLNGYPLATTSPCVCVCVCVCVCRRRVARRCLSAPQGRPRNSFCGLALLRRKTHRANSLPRLKACHWSLLLA